MKTSNNPLQFKALLENPGELPAAAAEIIRIVRIVRAGESVQESSIDAGEIPVAIGGERVTAASRDVILDWTPEQVWEELVANPNSILVDVRTQPEWAFVGIPDLSEIGKPVILAEWRSYPQMYRNPEFFEEVEARLGQAWPDTAFFICRSGVRSREAAAVFSERAGRNGQATRCINVAEGFEGDLDETARRGARNGWKYRGLAWKQS